MNVPFTPSMACGTVRCQLDMDIVRPKGGGPWPVFMLLMGGPAGVNRSDYELSFADALAHQGAVVFVADWRQSAAVGGGYPTSFNDIACAVGMTRAMAPRVGGNSRSVTLVGHSLGGWGGAVVALSPTVFSPRAGQCDATSGSLRPDAFVDLDGAVDEPTAMEDGAAYVGAFFGGTRAAKPAAYAAGDPFSILAAHHAGLHPMPILVVHGLSDATVPVTTSRAFHTKLISAGYPDRLLLIDGGHFAALASAAVVTAIVALVT